MPYGTLIEKQHSCHMKRAGVSKSCVNWKNQLGTRSWKRRKSLYSLCTLWKVTSGLLWYFPA